MKFFRSIFSFVIFFGAIESAYAQHVSKESFEVVQIDKPEMATVKQLYQLGKYDEAASALLQYYRKKTLRTPVDSNRDDETQFRSKTISVANQEAADNALLHSFKPHPGYEYFSYGADIDWTYWPVKDNEIRWQLHRLSWWKALGLAYQNSHDEKYARESVAQFRDWAKKNKYGISKENDRFAWRPLEVSSRLQLFPSVFASLVKSKAFTPEFLMEFLNSTHEQAEFTKRNYSAEGNHLLFEAQRVLGIGSFFPELKNAGSWRRSGIEILAREIDKQVFADGMQYELSPIYHAATIDIFLKALRSARLAGIEGEFPISFGKKVEAMVVALANISFPDYQTPMFGDAWLVEKSNRLKQVKDWSETFPDNVFLKAWANGFDESKAWPNLSTAFKDSGFYVFRNGWTENATVMVLKASPPGEFHAQPDNGTFELWRKGRNFLPDSGSYVYSGNAEIMAMRNWYRQSKVHNTLTLDDKNMLVTNAKLLKWRANNPIEILTYVNPSYANLNHARSVLFIDQKYYLIFDQAIGSASGQLGVHFHLKEDSNPEILNGGKAVVTRYADGNNLLIQGLNNDSTSLRAEEGKVSYQYKQEQVRPAYVFEKKKDANKESTFTTMLFPFDGNRVPAVTIREKQEHNLEKGIVELSITIDGKVREVSARLF